MAPCSLVESDRRFGGNYCHNILPYKRRECVLQNQTTRRHIPKSVSSAVKILRSRFSEFFLLTYSANRRHGLIIHPVCLQIQRPLNTLSAGTCTVRAARKYADVMRSGYARMRHISQPQSGTGICVRLSVWSQ
jgi:hypothetical protein